MKADLDLSVSQDLSLFELYESDQNLWFWKNVNSIRNNDLNQADWVHIAEVLEEMGKREYREILSRMRILLSHLLKWKYQQEFRSNSWRATIVEERKQLIDEFTDSKNLENYGRDKYEKAYLDGIDLASAETGFSSDLFPHIPEFTFESMLDENFFPE